MGTKEHEPVGTTPALKGIVSSRLILGLTAILLSACESDRSAREALVSEQEAQLEKARQKDRRRNEKIVRQKIDEIDRLIQKYAGEEGTPFWNGAQVHSMSHEGNTYSGDVLIIFAGNPEEGAKYCAGASAVVTDERVNITGLIGTRTQFDFCIPFGSESKATLHRDGRIEFNARESGEGTSTFHMVKLNRPIQ